MSVTTVGRTPAGVRPAPPRPTQAARPAPAPWDPPRQRGETPWTAGAVAVTATLTGLAMICLLIGYIVVSGTLKENVQLAGVDCGIASLLLSGGAAVGWLTVGYRNVRTRQRRTFAKIGVVEELRDLVPVDDIAALEADHDWFEPAEPTTSLVAVPGGSLYHLRGCLLVGGKETEPVSDSERHRLQPCGVCCK